jgi:hypothetical protein
MLTVAGHVTALRSMPIFMVYSGDEGVTAPLMLLAVAGLGVETVLPWP